MEQQKRIARMINGLSILAIVFFNEHGFISRIAILLIMILNFWNLQELKKCN